MGIAHDRKKGKVKDDLDCLISLFTSLNVRYDDKTAKKKIWCTLKYLVSRTCSVHVKHGL